jgi:hypothetical protein
MFVLCSNWRKHKDPQVITRSCRKFAVAQYCEAVSVTQGTNAKALHRTQSASRYLQEFYSIFSVGLQNCVTTFFPARVQIAKLDT